MIGATGRQGGAVAHRLIETGWRVRAVVRNPQSAGAAALERAGITVVKGNLDDRSSLVQAFRGVTGVFGVTDFWEHGIEREVAHGCAIADAVCEAEVERYVFSSVGGTDRTEGLGISHFDGKRRIEAHVRSAGIRATILRPVTFLDNFDTARFRRNARVWGVLPFGFAPSGTFQMIAMADVARFAELAFRDPDTFAGQAMEIASDAFTMPEFAAAIGRALGRPVRYRYLPGPVQRLMGSGADLFGLNDTLHIGSSLVTQFAWNNTGGHGGWNADLPRLRALNPDLVRMEDWVGTIDWRA